MSELERFKRLFQDAPKDEPERSFWLRDQPWYQEFCLWAVTDEARSYMERRIAEEIQKGTIV